MCTGCTFHAQKGHDLDNMASFHAWGWRPCITCGVQVHTGRQPDQAGVRLHVRLAVARPGHQPHPARACRRPVRPLSCMLQHPNAHVPVISHAGTCALFVLLLMCFACAQVSDACIQSQCEAIKRPRSHQATGPGGPNRQSRPSLRTAACERRTRWQDQSTQLTAGHCSTGSSHHLVGSVQVCSSCDEAPEPHRNKGAVLAQERTLTTASLSIQACARS